MGIKESREIVMPKLYIYSKTKNEVIEIKSIEVIAENKSEALCRITTQDEQQIFEKRQKPVKVYDNKEEAEREE